MTRHRLKFWRANKKGASHQGWYRRAAPWMYHSPLNDITLFDYQLSRRSADVKDMLDNFGSYRPTGMGYMTSTAKKHHPVACWAHARREFERALDNDKIRAEYALILIQKL